MAATGDFDHFRFLGPRVVYSHHTPLGAPFIFHILTSLQHVITRRRGDESAPDLQAMLVTKIQERCGASCVLDTASPDFNSTVAKIVGLRQFRLVVNRAAAFYTATAREEALLQFSQSLRPNEFNFDAIIMLSPRHYINIQLIIAYVTIY